MFTRQFAAKDTVYKGVRFRSRLEAKWAAFFDAIGWDWTYEPVDLGDWSPDFLVDVRADGRAGPVYAEVKPYHDVRQFAGHPATRRDALLLGIEPGTALFRQHFGWRVFQLLARIPGCDLRNATDRMARTRLKLAWAEAGNATRFEVRRPDPA